MEAASSPSDRRGGPPEARGGSPELLGDILRRVMRDVRPARGRRRDAILRAWEGAAGPEIAALTRPATLRQGVLTIEVRSAGLLHELRGFRQQELLDRFLEAAPEGRVRELRFRLGVF